MIYIALYHRFQVVHFANNILLPYSPISAGGRKAVLLCQVDWLGMAGESPSVLQEAVASVKPVYVSKETLFWRDRDALAAKAIMEQRLKESEEAMCWQS